LRLLLAPRVAETIPDIYMKPVISMTTLLTTIVIGVFCVALAPLLTWRRLSRMDVPGSLKITE
jgi:putative ABC transport system permease protein